MATMKFLHSPHQTSIKTPRLKFSNRPINFIKPPSLSSSSSSSSLHKSTPHSAKPLHFPLLASTNPSSNSSRISSKSFDGREIVVRLGEALSLGFPIWVGSASIVALWRPPAFLWVGRNLQIVGLTLTMLGMGMTLTLDDLKAALLMPKQLVAGFVLQYTVMPLSGYFVSKLLKLPSYYAAGLILVACCPGGTASNVVTYLAKGNVALSVLMTAASTFTAAVMTPFLTSKLAGQFVAVDPTGLFVSTVQVVLAPVLVGAALNQYCNDLVDIVSPLMPFIAVATVAILCGSAIAQNASAILTSGFQVVVAVFALHGSGFLFGYLFSRMLGIDVTSSRTISIEVGMQNSMLGLVLANQHFGNPLTTVPIAVSSICHSIYGSALAGIWRCMPPTKDGDLRRRQGEGEGEGGRGRAVGRVQSLVVKVETTVVAEGYRRTSLEIVRAWTVEEG